MELAFKINPEHKPEREITGEHVNELEEVIKKLLVEKFQHLPVGAQIVALSAILVQLGLGQLQGLLMTMTVMHEVQKIAVMMKNRSEDDDDA